MIAFKVLSDCWYKHFTICHNCMYRNAKSGHAYRASAKHSS